MAEEIDLARLKALAAKATPGPRIHGDHGAIGAVSLEGEPFAQVFQRRSGSGAIRAEDNAQRNANAAYIAALDPATVLELIRRAERAEELEAKMGRDSDIPLEELERNQTDECWTCKIGDVRRSDLPDGSDLPMRNAVWNAFYSLTGRKPRAIFSGWGKRWRETELAVIENRMPRGQWPQEPT